MVLSGSYHLYLVTLEVKTVSYFVIFDDRFVINHHNNLYERLAALSFGAVRHAALRDLKLSNLFLSLCFVKSAIVDPKCIFFPVLSDVYTYFLSALLLTASVPLYDALSNLRLTSAGFEICFSLSGFI